MSTVMLLWASGAGAALTVAGAHGALWLLDRRVHADLALCVVALAVAGLAVTELGMMHSVLASEYGDWVRWFHVPSFFAVAGLVAFVHLQFGTGRVWLAGLVVGLRALLLLLNFLLDPNLNWSEISGLRTIYFLGEPVSVVGDAVVRRPLQWLATLASLLFIVYVADALATAWRGRDRETRRKAMVICGAMLVFITLAILESQLVVWNLLHMPVVVAPLFLIPVAAITYEMNRALAAAARMERETARLRDELAHASRVKMVGQLSAVLAHELAQPLTSILANAQAAQLMLRTGKLDVSELLAILADICAADRHADAIIERARGFLKRSRSELQAVSVDAVARDVLALVQRDAANQGITLELSIPQDLPPIRADRVQISQVLLNLVVNAMDAVGAADRAGERKVGIRATHGRGQVEIAVTDSGAGIPQEMLPRLFDAFVTTKQAGLGIGLALSRSIVQAHGGDLHAESTPGGGATLRFTLAALSDP
jgi:signal transduction histidine kinase